MRRAPMSERGKHGFHAKIREAAEGLGYHVAHVNTSGSIVARANKSMKGFPDFILTKPGRLIFAEVKGDEGDLSREQAAWAMRLNATGCAEVYSWWPEDYDDAVHILAAQEKP